MNNIYLKKLILLFYFLKHYIFNSIIYKLDLEFDVKFNVKSKNIIFKIALITK